MLGGPLEGIEKTGSTGYESKWGIMSAEEKNIPPGVWVFWAILGLGLLIALFRWATGGNPAYIAPIAASVSAVAAAYAVYMTTKTFNQNRKDRKEEIESKHPRFVVVDGAVVWVAQLGGDYSITPFYQLSVDFKNVKENSAKHVSLKGDILDKNLNVLKSFEVQPTDYIEHGGTFNASVNAEGIPESPDPYYVRMYLRYRDVRTGDRHNQTLWRKFYMEGEEGDALPLLRVDKSELKANELAQSGITRPPELEA